ncbi:MAG: hypothetical protein E7212_14095 [Clostridium sartagoforme]|nr:hypothetical protein [Clostridium sartagoforme]
MRHLKNINKEKFYKEPMEFNKYSNRSLLEYAIGSNLYMNALMDFYNKIKLRKIRDITTITICFEDSINEGDVNKGEINVLKSLDSLIADIEKEEINEDLIPLIFIRVRNIKQFINLSSKLSKEQLKLICGFIFPKFNKINGLLYLDHLERINKEYGDKVYGMPILESEEIIFKEKRIEEILYIKELIDKYKSLILNIRVGGTDFSSKFSLRRNVSNSIYEIGVINDCLADIVNVFGRYKDEYVISAPVWEYFSEDIKSKETLGLIREIKLDKANGFCGKTIIHPCQGIYVNSMYSVEYEDYIDALNILSAKESVGGVFKGYSNNKMNEISPHYNWARKICSRANAYGVLDNKVSYKSLYCEKGMNSEN